MCVHQWKGEMRANVFQGEECCQLSNESNGNFATRQPIQ
ncbi:hypothetical protein COLO4_22764 [Corchorus olitorius]|uniref:Uncharacterized protein n=1 Tax=Corchorus olitorius TaxID=93759 RepID=A0A1R3IK23_9ROSI|nr:hypothetical protein COLO4_22764 [Corchorus olitorius]